MKIQKSPGKHKCQKSGFTLIELLAVVSIIIILAAITVNGIGAFQRTQASKATMTRMKFLETKMEEYKLDNGAYPDPGAFGDAGSTKKTALALAGRNESGGRDENLEVYWADLDPNNGKDIVNSSWQIMDSYGAPFRLRGTDNPNTVNPDFDLWSIGPDGVTNAVSPDDEKNKDDIRNF